MQLTFDRVLKTRKLRFNRYRSQPSSQRPMFHFDFSDCWTFGRCVKPILPMIEDFSNQVFEANLDELAMLASRPLNGSETDFVWVALVIYIADRYAARRPFGPNSIPFWRRRIHVRVPVQDPGQWIAAERLLIKALEFLTEDDWSFEFIAKRTPFPVENQERFRKLAPPNASWVSLFSGGLDSLAGALHWLQRVQGTGLLVSGQTHHRMKDAQNQIVSDLRNAFPGRVEHCAISYRLPAKLESSGMDSSQRTRSFVHISLGILSAVLVGHRQLFIFENGIGSFNLSCDHSQTGSQNSRGTHPILLRYMSAFASAYFENRITVANPFLFMTKGQMLAQPTMNGFEDLLQRSFSCDRFPNYHRRASQCGHCPSCLIRRLSFHASSRPDDLSGYSFDIFSPHLPPRDREVFAFNKLSAQAEAISARIGADEVWESLSSVWPILILSDTEMGKPGFRDAVVELFKRHSIEWQNLRRSMEYQRLPNAA